ncbi:MAG: ABC transporter permease [Gemmatimonadales bacterium]
MDLSLDLRQALRALRRGRALTLATVLILALGIGSAATMYAVVDQILLRPLPVRDQSRVVVAWGAYQASGFGHVPLSYSNMAAIRSRTQVFEQVAALDYNGAWAVVGRAGAEALPLRLGIVAGELFGTLGVPPLFGRALRGDDDRIGAAPVAVISQGLWLRRFGGDSGIIGKPLPIWAKVYTIVGVMPGDLDLPAGAEAWVTTSAIHPAIVTQEDYGSFDLVGRLRPGRTIADAKEELDRLLLETNPEAWNADSRLTAVVRSLGDVIVGQVRPALLVLLSAALLVFLVAVLNLGGLLVVRTLERQHELALRRALGASRLVLIRQVTVEGGIVVALGGVVGIGLAWTALHLIPAITPKDLPRVEQLELRPGVVLLSLALAALGVVLAGALPALSITDSHLGYPRGGIARVSEKVSRAPARTVAVAVQVALAIVTVATAFLLARTLAQLQRLEPGFEPSDLSVLQVAFLSPKIESSAQAIALMDGVLGRVRSVPGVQAATAVLQPPLSGTGGYDYGFVAEGQTEAEAAANPYLNYEAVTPDYFATLRAPILRGRGFTDADRAGAPLVVVVSRGLAERMWPGQNPLGKRMRWAADTTSRGDWRTVIGVVNDSRYRELLQLRPNVYVPLAQQEWVATYLVVRSGLSLDALFRSLRHEVQDVDPGLGLVNAQTMTALLARPLAQPRFNAAVLLGFGVIAVLLAAIGLYGLVSFLVTQRAREIGIRLAVGAQPRQIVGMFLRRGLAPLTAGSAAGVIAVFAGGRLLSSLLYGVTARDPTAIIGAVLGFTLVALLAALIPARRAAEGDPAAALRLE